MKVKATGITTEISQQEWKDIKKDWEKLIYADKPKKFEISQFHFLHDFMTNIGIVAQNLNHTIDKEVNKY